MRGGDLPPVDDPTREVVVVAARGSAEAAHRVVQLVTDSIPRALGIPADQVQVVTPVHRGPAGTLALNVALKAKLNPGTGSAGSTSATGWSRPPTTWSEDGFANGEVGVVAEVERDGTVTVEFASGPAEVKGKALADLLHGWAITVHRAQGSEFPAVVVVVPPEAGGMLSRPLVYTAMTRAQRHLSIVHAAGPALARAVRQIGPRPGGPAPGAARPEYKRAADPPLPLGRPPGGNAASLAPRGAAGGGARVGARPYVPGGPRRPADGRRDAPPRRPREAGRTRPRSAAGSWDRAWHPIGSSCHPHGARCRRGNSLRASSAR